jgi:predicted RecB family nuclease
MLVLNDHCQACEFRDSCYAQALKEDNLSLLRGMNKLQITRLNNKGIFTVNQLSYNFKARRRPKRAKKSAIVHNFPLQSLAIRDKKVFVHGNPALSCADTRIYLDIEGTQESGSSISSELLQSLTVDSLAMPIGLTATAGRIRSGYSRTC